MPLLKLPHGRCRLSPPFAPPHAWGDIIKGPPTAEGGLSMGNPPMGKKDLQKSAEEVIFESNLQEFTTKVGYICGLEQGGKLTPAQAYKQIKDLYKLLKTSKKNLLPKKPDVDGADAPE
jgi:hypothetical protein